MYMQRPIGQATGQSGRLISPSLSPSKAKCMSFYFYYTRDMVSSDIELTIFVRPTSVSSVYEEIPLWRMTSRRSKVLGYWNKGILPLMQKTNFEVCFICTCNRQLCATIVCKKPSALQKLNALNFRFFFFAVEDVTSHITITDTDKVLLIIKFVVFEIFKAKTGRREKRPTSLNNA
jgi:hypothetical protein